MNMNNKLRQEIVKSIVATYENSHGFNHIEGPNLPDKQAVLDILQDLISIVFPSFDKERALHWDMVEGVIGDLVDKVYKNLVYQVSRAITYSAWTKQENIADVKDKAIASVENLLRSIPDIRNAIKTDVQAAYDGDPAAQSFEEVIIAYPGLYAITVHRLAHNLFNSDIPIIPRIMNEHAHSKTGIDLHPGATIGNYFFIDHGTGVVIGETTTIGNYVKIYQGVTLGALSIPKNSQEINGVKRHPTIEDDVCIYSGATILGGKTKIGTGSVIGGNVWITKSIKPHTKVYIGKPDLIVIRDT